MSKKQKIRPVAAVTSSAHAKASPHSIPSQRDVLTGDHVESASCVIIVHDTDPHHRINRMHPPLALHIRQPDGHFGAPRWSLDFERYIGRVTNLAREVQQERQARKDFLRSHWWLHPACESELRAHFPSDAVDAILTILVSGMDRIDATWQWKMPLVQLRYYERTMAKHMRKLI